jgi:hypothetical protein
MNMSISPKVRAAFIAGITAIGLIAAGGGVSAHAASNAAGRPDTRCNFSGARKIYDRPLKHGNEIRHIQLWYSTSRCVWAVETNGQPGDIVWVWNYNTHEQSSVTSNGHSAATGEINDARSKSHACMSPKYSNGSYGPKTCTRYY